MGRVCSDQGSGAFRYHAFASSTLAESRGMETLQDVRGAIITQFQLHYGGFGSGPCLCLAAAMVFCWRRRSDPERRDRRAKERKFVAFHQVCRDAMDGFPSETNALSCTRVSALLNSYAALMRARANAGDVWIREYGLDEELAYLAKKVTGAAAYSLVEKNGIAYVSRSSVPSGFLALPPLAAQLPELLKLK